MSQLTASTNYQRTHANCGGIIDPPWPKGHIDMKDLLECRECRRDDVPFMDTRLTPICAEFTEYGTCIHSDHTP